MTVSIPPVTKQLVVNTSQTHAFRVFTAGMDRWWPRQHHIGASPMKEIIVEPRPGGRWFTICQDGSQCDIGKVLAWEPPGRLLLAWQITAGWTYEPSFVTEVEVVFTPVGARRTRVDFEHRQLDRYGEAAAALRLQLDDPKGWLISLEQFARSAVQKAVVFYESASDVLVTAPIHYPAHKARLDAFHGRGELLAVGLFGDPREGSMAVFRSREDAAEFVREDPFVQNGVVAKVTIKDWDETLLDG